jgi:hypothetical protein
VDERFVLAMAANGAGYGWEKSRETTGMTPFVRRAIGAGALDRGIYEEVEADAAATRQAIGLVLLASVAGGIGLSGFARPNVGAIVAGIPASLIAWIAWAALTYLIGSRLLPEPQTKANVGELLRTIGFASAPGVLRVFGVLPVIGPLLYATASIWMLFAMVVAVRQALDYRSTARAVSVCVVGWLLSLVIAAVFGLLFGPTVS